MQNTSASNAENTPSIGQVAAWLEDLAASTGERAFARAAASLRQLPPGRTSIDDGRALAEVRHLISTGHAKSDAHACRLVARTLGPRSAVKATAERLRRKLRAEAK